LADMLRSPCDHFLKFRRLIDKASYATFMYLMNLNSYRLIHIDQSANVRLIHFVQKRSSAFQRNPFRSSGFCLGQQLMGRMAVPCEIFSIIIQKIPLIKTPHCQNHQNYYLHSYWSKTYFVSFRKLQSVEWADASATFMPHKNS